MNAVPFLVLIGFVVIVVAGLVLAHRAKQERLAAFGVAATQLGLTHAGEDPFGTP